MKTDGKERNSKQAGPPLAFSAPVLVDSSLRSIHAHTRAHTHSVRNRSAAGIVCVLLL